MKAQFILFSYFFLIIPTTSAQDLADRKIINANLHADLVLTPNQNNTNFDLSVLAGRIKANNTYLAIGGAVSGINNSGDSKSSVLNIGPAIEYGKFMKIVDNFYMAPIVGGNIQGVFSNSFGLKSSLYAVPIRMMYKFSNHVLLSASFGEVSLNTSFLKSLTIINLNGTLNNASSFGVYYTFK